jgi:hypothetical protein
MTPEIDLEALRLPRSMTAPMPSPKRPPRHRQGERFLKGPIPWAWLELAGRLPGQALHVAIALWQQAGIVKRRTVRFGLTRLLPMGIGPQAARRGLRNLERIGLVTVSRNPGRTLEVTLCETPKPAPERNSSG